MYREKINDSIGNVYNSAIATKILKYMNDIRNASDITQARRWVMELLQNARDIARKGKPLRVQIELTDDVLYFRHSGMPFRVKDILSIVNQVSSKLPGEGVGQFGTGFMTTYQLSEKVEIRSLLKDEGLPGKRFCVTLDRTGHSQEEILSAIFLNIDQLKDSDDLPDSAESDPDEGFDTEFRYLLETNRSRDIAKTGVTDLADTILYVMLFSEGIGSVEISINTSDRHENIIYRRGECVNRSGCVEELTVIEEHQGGEQKPHKLLFTRNNDLTLATEYDAEQGFLPISERTPRIFVDFPLIGAERFPFPVVINSLELCPNEPRSGISLVDNADSVDAQKNKAIMLSAVNDYKAFVNELIKIDTKGAENLIGIFEWQDNKEWSEAWVKENLYSKVYNIIKELEIIPTTDGNKSLSYANLFLIRCDSGEEKEYIRRLVDPLNGYLVPTDDTDWHKVLKAYELDKNKFIDLKRLLDGASVFMSKHLNKDILPAMEWNCLLYEAGMNNPDLAKEIQAGNIAVFPSQSLEDQKVYKLYTSHQIYRDPNIPESLKDVAEKVHRLDELSGRSGFVKLRSVLLPREFRLINENAVPEYSLPTLIEYIQNHCSRGYKVANFNSYSNSYDAVWVEAWRMMTTCGPDDDMYEICNKWFTNKLPERNKIEDERFPNSLWGTTYRGLLERMITRISSLSTLSQITIEPLYPWLNTFYKKCRDHLRESELAGYKLYPNQEGKLFELRYLYRDSIQEEELKEIALCFEKKDPGCNLYHELLDRSVVLDGWSMAEKKDLDAALRIDNIVQKLLRECSLSQAEMIYQEACSRLMGWIEEHPKQAEEYFPSFCKEEDCMKLLTTKAAVLMHKKAKELEAVKDILGTDDPAEVEKLVNELKELRKSSQQAESAEKSAESCYDPATGVMMDAEIMAMDKHDRERVCREIGDAGEQYAFELARSELMKLGCQLTEERPGMLTFTKGEDTRYTLCRPDTESYRQPGYDIRITRNSQSRETVWYLEAKTHTPRSVRKGVLQISNEQMKLAAEHREHYIILSMTYEYKSKQVTNVNLYSDPCSQLASGKLRNLADGYWFGEQLTVNSN